MKKLLITICVIAIFAGCGDSKISDSVLQTEGTMSEINTIVITTEPKEDYSVVANLNGEKKTIFVGRINENNDLISIEEQLYLAQRAVDLLIDLKNDYDNTVGQIRFEPNDNLGEDFPYEESVKAIFNNERVITAMGLFGYINVYNSFCCCEKNFNVVIGVVFSDIEKLLFWGISFTKENEEWIINSVYPSI